MTTKQYKLWIIVGIFLLNSIRFYIVLPLLPFLIAKYLRAQQVVVSMSALMSVFANYSFFSALVFGALSNRYGRKNIHLMTLLGSVIGYVLFGIGGALRVLFWDELLMGSQQVISVYYLPT